MQALLDRFDAIFIWGFGREGHAVLAACEKAGLADRVIIIDAKRPDPLPAQTRYCSEADMMAQIKAATSPLLVKSPGISLYDERVDAAKAAGATLTSQTNLYFQTKPASQRVIGVTGTKGKSTTSALVHHMLSALGQSAALAGNIGIPVLETPREADVVVLELSSYQIADLAHAPDLFVFLNMLSDHAPWHHGIEQYRADKMRLAELDPNALGVMNANDARLSAAFKDRPNTHWFGSQTGFHLKDGVIYQGQARLGAIKSLPGEHNALNACAALTLIEQLGFNVQQAFDSLASFNGLPHRLQTVHSIGQVDFVDDVLATTPEACLLAIKAFHDRDIALIVGGEDRQQDYDLLREGLADQPHVKAVITTPDNGNTISRTLRLERVQDAKDLPEAVLKAFKALDGKGVVLLSPAAPRGRDFKDFAHRGAVFLSAAKLLG